jgi:hypothetical protein
MLPNVMICRMYHRTVVWYFRRFCIFLIFCWPCIIVYQYNENNVMHFSFNLLRIKSLYTFRALFSHPQEALHKRHLVYCVRVMSVGCAKTVLLAHPQEELQTALGILRACNVSWLCHDCGETVIVAQPTDITRTQYTKSRLCRTSWGCSKHVEAFDSQ